jgi:ABC-type polysaccharide/polyol phosphate transport system ATPase subunit
MKGTVEVSHVSKEFKQNPAAMGNGAPNLRDRFSFDLGAKRRRAQAERPKVRRSFQALNDVTFRVEPGSALGIVGHNGSGKSTMLKLLTGIMRPTSGKVRTMGRVGALIEVGAGFHPDLTGRENVYLSGSIQGLKRREVAQRFDEIVSFAGLEQFIDTPVKRYSSGMYMRLGFAIAAHLEPDILLIDEVLAVGDAYFQNKCIRRMKEFQKNGGTILFVSHAMGQVAELCPECVWLDHGQLFYHGKTEEAVSRYLNMVAEREHEDLRRNLPTEWELLERDREQTEREEREAAAVVTAEREAADAARRRDSSRSYLYSATMIGKGGEERTHFQAGEPVTFRIVYRLGRPVRDPVLVFQIHRTDGLYMYGTSNYDHGLSVEGLPQKGEVVLQVPSLNLNEGRYRLRFLLASDPSSGDFSHFPLEGLEDTLEFSVSGGMFAHGCTYMPVFWPDNVTPIDRTAASPISRSNSEPVVIAEQHKGEHAVAS